MIYLSMHKIKVINDFISDNDVEKYIQYIDTNLEKFYRDPTGLRYAWMFGKDLYHQSKSAWNTEGIADMMPELLPIFDKVINEVRLQYDEPEIHIASFWFGKQDPGAVIDGHYDVDDGSNTHMKYSGLIYLNSMGTDGELFFNNIPYTYEPKKADLVLFPSDGEEYWHEVEGISEERYTLLFWFTTQEEFKLEIVY